MSQHSVLHPHGEMEWADRESDRKIVRDCLQCCHCQYTWFVVPGSGKRRGFCMRCMAPTCGAVKCHECIPWRQKLELIESRKAGKEIWSGIVRGGTPISVSVPAGVPKKLILGRG